MQTMSSARLRLRTATIAALDCFAWAFALSGAVVWRLQDPHVRSLLPGLAVVVSTAVISQLAVGWVFLYRFRWRIGSFEEVCALAVTWFATGCLVLVAALVAPDSIPPSAMVGGAAVAFVVVTGARGSWRLVHQFRQPRADDAPRSIIFGAGEASRQLVEILLATGGAPYRPVALLDDDVANQHFKIRHLEVLGTRWDISRTARATGATTFIIAIPSANAELVRILTQLAEEAELQVRILPHVSTLFNGLISVDDIHPVTEEDLLGRRIIDTEIDSIAKYLNAKRVLVTGAGGSIGSELCRQIHRFGPSELIMLDRDETGIHQVQLSLEGRATLDSRNLAVCDIRDVEGLDAVFAEHHPDVVFHAAALKHLPLLEMWPAEAFKTNVLGTLNVLHAARRYHVSTFVNISTDKAANPQSVLGYSKRIAERITAEFAEPTGPDNYLSVRFGNVLGSRGSVVPTFRSQIEAGGPITVTDPNVTRFFMTIEEAVQLVIQAGAIGRNGDVLILDMGEPVRIDDMAHRLARESPVPIRVVYVGLRPGEKLQEELFGAEEVVEPTDHALITRAPVPPIPIEDVVRSTLPSETSIARRMLESLASSSRAKLGAPASVPTPSSLVAT
jgi:FlaA1/EpsC-like NDP-sugar epimerase